MDKKDYGLGIERLINSLKLNENQVSKVTNKKYSEIKGIINGKSEDKDSKKVADTLIDYAEDFMNELNMIYSDNSTLLSKVFDSLSKLLSYIFGVDNNTLFYKSLTESLELINPELDTTQAIEDNINTSNLQISEKENNKIPKATLV